MRRILAAIAILGGLLAGAHPAQARTPVCCNPPRPVHIPGSGEIMALGDSITAGYCSVGSGYRGYLDTALTAANYGHTWIGSQVDLAGLRHEGHGGWTIDQLAAQAPGWLAASPPMGIVPEWVLLDAGTNDDGQNATSAQMLSSMSALLDKILAASPYVKVLVAKITITTYNTPLQQAQEEAFDEGLPALAVAKGPRVRTVDMRGVELAPESLCTPPGVHPDDAGYADMSTRWYTAIQQWRGVM